MAELVPADDMPSGLVPEDDLPEPSRKTPKQMRGLLPPEAQKALLLGRQALNLTPFGAVLGISEKLGEIPEAAGGKVTDIASRAGASPEVAAGAGYGTNLALSAIPAFLSPGKKVADVALKDLVKMDTLKEAQKLGLDVPPSLKGAGAVEKGIESIGGKADVAREMSARNREAVQVIARREAGIPENQPLTEETLAQARNRIAQPYRQISSLSPQAAKALEKLKQVRQEAKVYHRHYDMQGDPKSLKEAQRLDDKAEALENRISKIAGDLAPDLLPALKQARTQIAKNYDIEKALNVGTGEIDARKIGRLIDKRGVQGVTGELGTVGKFAQAYPDFVQPKASATDVSALRPYASLLGLSLGAGAGGYELGKHYTGTNYGYVMAALPFLSPAARSLALSKLMQSGALGAGRSVERAAQSSLIPLSQVGRDDNAGP